MSSPADAQTPPDPAGQADPEVVVRGRHLAGSAVGDTAPIATLDAAAIASLGATTMADLRQRLAALAASASGGDPVTLLNGHRVASQDEIDALPPEAIERTEVLPEQDAARFGYPPTVRVVNFITKKHFRALATLLLNGATTDGGGGTSYTEANATRIDGARRATVEGSYLRQDRVLQASRRIAPDPADPFSLGGTVAGLAGGDIDPRLDMLAGGPVTTAAVPPDPAMRRALASYVADPPVPTDLGPFRTLQPRIDTGHLGATLAGPLAAHLSGSADLSLDAQGSVGLNGLAAATLLVPPGGPLPFAGPVVVDRYLPAALTARADSLTLHGGGALAGDWRRWTWSLTGAYDRVRSTALTEQGVPTGALQAAINAGDDPLAALDTATAAQRLVSRTRTVTGTLGGKVVANGPALRLPAGDAQVTLSTDYQRDTAAGALALARSTQGASVAVDLPLVSPEGRLLPLAGRLRATGSVSLLGVSNYGHLVSGSYALTWTPRSPFQLTASVTQTRTPPAVALLAAPPVASPDTPFFDYGTGATATVTAVTGGNPGLAPERRRVLTLGAALKPFAAREVRLTLNYLATRIDDQTTSFASATADVQAAFPALFTRDAAGRLVAADLRAVNLSLEEEHKLRLDLSFSGPLGRAAPVPPAAAPGAPTALTPPPPPPRPRPSVHALIDATWRLSDRLALRPGLPLLNLLDGASLTGTEGRSRWEVTSDLGISAGAVSIGAYSRFRGPSRVSGTLPSADLRFSGRSWIVLYGSFDAAKAVAQPWARKLTVQLTVENLLNDRVNVTDRLGATPNRFQPAYLDPLGRSIRIGLRKLF